MLLSIIIPIYNDKNYLADTLENVLNQTFKDFEIILVDDGSTDGSAEICDDFADKDKRIKVIHKENGGVSSARNTGVAAAKGKYIGFVDSDDIIEPEMYNVLIKLAEENDAGVVQCRHNRLSSVQNTEYSGNIRLVDGKTFVEEIFTYSGGEYTNQVSLCTKVFRKELFEGIIFPVGQTYEDEQETYKLCLKADKIVLIQDELYHYVRRENSIITGFSAKKMIDEQLSLMDRMIYLPIRINHLQKTCVDSFLTYSKQILCLFYSNGKKTDIKTVLFNIRSNKKLLSKFINKYDRIYFKLIYVPIIRNIIFKYDFEPIQKFISLLRSKK